MWFSDLFRRELSNKDHERGQVTGFTKRSPDLLNYGKGEALN